MSDQVSKIISIAQTAALFIGGYYVYQFLKTGSAVVDDATTFLADIYTSATSNIVKPTMAVRSVYFVDGKLKNDARNIYAENFPNMYFKIFAQDRLKPEFASLLDNGDRYTDDEFSM